MKKLFLCALSLLFLGAQNILGDDTLLSIAKTKLETILSLEVLEDCSKCALNLDPDKNPQDLPACTTYCCLNSSPCDSQSTVDTNNAKINSDNAAADTFNQNQIQNMQNLLTQGADPNVMDEHNCTPLRYVVADRENIEMATMLLKAGANKTINNKDSYFNKTVLAYATDAKNQEMINLLTSYGATN